MPAPTPSITKPALQTLSTSKDKEEVFKVFESSRPSVRMITPTGFRIIFTGHKYITQNAEAIAYLNQCIDAGVPGLAVGEDVTSDDLNPEVALRKKYFAEFLAAQAEATSEGRDFGTTADASGLKGTTTKQVAN